MNHLEHTAKRRKGILALVIASALTSTVALAANPHCPGNKTQVIVGDDSVTVSGQAAGFGEPPVTAELSAEATVEIQCENAGGNIAPGQTQQTEATGTVELDPTDTGQLSFVVTSDPIEAPQDACPNPGWTPSVSNVTFGDIEVRFVQEGQQVMTIDCQLVDGQYECICS
jgi:hypothetical protein